MNKEDYKLLPLVAVGLLRGLGEVIIKPFVVEQSEKVRHVTAAAIHYYTTGEPHEPSASD